MEGRPPEERELVLRARQGDERAFEQLVRTHQEVAFRVAYVVTGNAADAEDAAQDGFVKAWRALGRFHIGRPFRPWVLKIVANEARNRRRSASRRLQLTLRAEGQRVSGDATPSPEAAAVDADERRRILEGLNGLPENARLVLTCRFLLGLSEEETSSVLELRRGTVKSRTARALEQLKKEADD